MSAAREYEKITKSFFLVTRAGATYILSPEQKKEVDARMLEGCEVFQIEGNTLTRYSIDGIFTFKSYMDNKFKSESIIRKINDLKYRVQYEPYDPDTLNDFVIIKSEDGGEMYVSKENYDEYLKNKAQRESQEKGGILNVPV